MSTPQQPGTEGTSADHSRSGADLAEGIAKAEHGSAVQEVHDDPRNPSGAVEQAAADPEMTEGQVVLGEREGSEPGNGEGGEPGAGKDPREAGSGGAQSQPGPRASDRESAGQPRPEGPPFTG